MKKLNMKYDNVQLNVKFTKSGTRSDLNVITDKNPTGVTNENISLTLGKISKWYEALVPTGGSSGKILAWNSAGTAKWSDPLHPTITKSADTTSTASPAHGGTFTTVDSVTRDGNGHVTKINTKTVTLPSQYTHPTYSRSDTSSTVSPAHGGTFTAIDSVTSSNGHVTSVNLKTITLPAQYTHPTYTSKSSGLYKITVDGTGHVSGTAAVTKSDIPALDYVPNTKSGVITAINLLDEATANITSDDAHFISQENNGSTTNYYRRKFSGLWGYINGKISAETTGSGNAVTSVSYSNGKITATKGSTFSLSSHTHAYTVPQAFTIKTGSSDQSHITLQTLMTWLITTKGYITSNTARSLTLYTSWNYAGNDILQLTIDGTAYELQLAGVIIEFDGYASDYQTGTFRLRIHSSPTVSFTPASGYTQFPASHIAEYTCNGSGYSPTWKMLVDKGDTVTRTGGGASGTWGISISGTAASANKLNTNAGSNTRPVYFTGGIPVAVNNVVSGTYHTAVPFISSDGVMEVGKYIDFHEKTSTNDFDCRLTSTTTGLIAEAVGASNALTIKSAGYAQIRLATSASDKAYTATGIVGYPLNTTGLTTIFNFGGNTVVGGGESASTLYDNNYDTIKTSETETLYLSSDSSAIHLITNAQTYSNIKVVKIDSGNVVLDKTGAIIQTQDSTSNYTTAIRWWKGGTNPGDYPPSIGQHNTGGDSTNPGSICILPYQTTTSPWGGNVGLFIRKDHVYIDGTELSKVGHNHDYLPLAGGTMTGDITFTSISGGSYPIASKGIKWGGGTDAIDMYYNLRASDAGELIINMRDDSNVRTSFAYNGTVKSYIDTNGVYNGTATIANKLGTANKGSATKGIYLNAGAPAEMTYSLGSTVNGGTANQLAYYSGANAISATHDGTNTGDSLYFKTGTNEKSARQIMLGIYGQTYGNDASTLISGTAGVLSYGDGGPQIDFSAASSVVQAGSLIFTDHDAAGTGASWHFVSNQTDWNVISKRFHARTSISIGTNTPNTSYNLYVNGTANITGAVTFGDSVTASTFTGNLTGNALKTGVRWNAVSQGQKWSRLYYSAPAVNVEGSNGILTISCTRGNTVINAIFLVYVSHPGSKASHITELASTNYSTIRCRVVSNSNGAYYFEIYDTATSIASGTAQTWHCCFVPLTDATITTYTAFTDGSTIPSNFAAANDFTTTVGSTSAAIKAISRSGTTFTATRQDGTTFTFNQQDNDTTYTIATGDNNGQIKVTPSSGSAYNIGVKGLGSAAYTESSDYVPKTTVSSLTDADTLFSTTQWVNWNTWTAIETTHMPTTNYGLLLVKASPGPQVFFPDTGTGIYLRKKAVNSDATAWMGITGNAGTTYNLSNFYKSTTSRTANTVLAAPNGSDGAATFRKLVAADIPSLSYLPLTGGNVSGGIYYKSTKYDGSAANNGVSSGSEYPTTFNILDKSSRILVRLEGIINSTGAIGSYWYIRNYNTSGTQVAQKGISMSMAKDGTFTYTVSDGANFRSAIGAGTSSLTIGTTATTAAAGNHTHNYAGSSSAGGAATNIATEVGSSAGARPVFYAYLGDNTRVVYNTNFTYNPSGNVLTATTFAGALSGNATSATTASKLGSSTVGSTRRPIYLNSGTATEANYMVSHFGNAGKSNMNDVGKMFASVGMTNLSDPGNTVDNPMNGTTKSTSWHLYWDACFSDDPSGSNGWVAQIANKAGSAQWWVRSRQGGTITNGTEWSAGWEHLTITSQAGAGSATNPVYVDSNGHTQACTYSLNKSVPSNALFTDSNVRQSATATTDYRPIVTGAKNTTTIADLDDEITSTVYTSENFFVQPSTGSLYATHFFTKSYLSGTGVNVTSNGIYARSYFKRADNTVADYKEYLIRTYNGKITSNDGILVSVGGGGLTIVGGGESSSALAGLISDDQTKSDKTTLNVGGTLNTAIPGNSEQLIMSSDESIYFITNCQTIANRKPVCLNTSSYFYPGTNKTGSIGTSSYMWNSVYAATIYENGTSLASKYAAIGHAHGLLHSDLTQVASNGTTGGWSVIGIDPAVAAFVLKSIRINQTSPNWLCGDFGAGIAFGGADTKGVISMKYQSPVITFAGGNHASSKTEPVWYLKISGTSGSTYNLDNLLWATLLKPISTTTTASASTWNIPSGSYQVWGERFADTRLKYTPSGGSETTITDTGDLVMWLTGNATTNAATLNMRIDGTYYGSFSGNLSGNATTASSASLLGPNTKMDYGWNGVNYFNISGTAGNAAKVNDTPTSAWWHIMRFNHANNAGYYTDLAVPFNDVSLYYKRISNGVVQNGGWVKVLDAFRIGYNYSASIKYDPHEKKFTCTKSNSAWNAQAFSAQGFSDNVYVSFRAGQTTSYIMIGLDSNPSEDADYKNIDYCWYIRNDGSLQVYESGTGTTISGHTTYATGDEFKVEYSAGSIKYYHNGVLCRRVIRSISGKLFFDSSFHTAGNIYNFEFGTSCDIANYDKPLTSYYKSESYVTSLTSSAITIQDQSGSFGGWMCGPTKNGRIAVASYQGYDDKLYFGYGERGRTTNSYVKTMTWDGPTNTLSADKFVGALQGNVTGNCSGTAGSTAKLTIASTNTASTSTNTYATNGLNIRWFNATGKLPGQPSQYGFCLTMSIEDGGAETHQIFATQANGSLYHRGTNGSSYQSPPAFATILDSSNYTGYTVKKDGTGASGSWGISITGNANTATIASQVIDTNINSGSSEILKTSSKNRIYRSLTNYTRGNVFAFIPAADIAVEYSTNNGSNWTNMGLSNEEKANLFIMKCFGNVPIGPNTTASRTTSMKTRITITFSETRGHFDQITLTTASGGDIIKCDIYRNDTSTVVKTGVTMTAISNSAETTSVSTGNSYYINPSDGTAKKLIFIFSYTAASSTPAYIRDISAYGPAAGMYQGPSSTIINNMKNFDHLYTWDYTKKMIVSYGLSVTGDVSIANRYTFPATSTDCPAGMSGVLYSNSTGATTVDNLTISSNCTHLKIQLYDSTVGCYSIHDVAFVSGGVTTVLLQSAVFGQSFPLDVTPAQFKINTGTKSGTYKIIFSTGTKISIRNSGNTSGTANTVKMVKIWACS